MRTISQDTLQFLMDNHFHNSRDWFLAHKGDYTKHVLEPLQDLVMALSPTVLAIDGALVTEPRVDKTISRIYRDTRFSRDKNLYKDHAWIVFRRDKAGPHFGPACYFFEIALDHFHYGCGYYHATPGEMAAVRELVLEGHPEFAALRAMLAGQDRFAAEGERYKRIRYPDAPADLQPWLDRKNLYFTHRSRDLDLLFSPELAAQVASGFLLLEPAYRFFLAAHARMRRP